MSENPVQRLTQLLQTDPVEFDIAILRGNDEKGDPFVLQEGHLGVNAGDLAWLARDFRRAYRTIRSSTQQQPELLLNVTGCLLLVCPDHATAWADRKRALLLLAFANDDDSLSTCTAEQTILLWTKELQFVSLLMTRHTKAPTSWFHRKYVLQKLVALNVNLASVENLMALARDEIQICTKVAERYPKNYYAWTHRIWILQTIKDAIYTTSKNITTIIHKDDPFPNLVQQEWQSIEPWLRTHVSDHSAAHFGGYVLRLLLDVYLQEEDTAAAESLMVGAVETARRLVEAYPTHEVLWIFRRICSHAFLLYLDQTKSTSTASGIEEVVKDYWSKEIVKQLVDDKSPSTEHVELRLELTTAKTHRLAYVAWVLECIKSAERGGKTTQIHFGIDQTEVLELREKAIALLREMESIPHHTYRIG